MQMSQLDQILQVTNADHWELIEAGPTFLHSYLVVGGGPGSSRIAGVEYHDSIAVLKADIDIRIAWGYDPDFGERRRQFFGEHTFPDSAIGVELSDVFFRGALVQRRHLISVDGGRAVLPMPRTRRKADTAPTSRSHDDFEQVVTRQAVNCARLVDRLSGNTEFDTYLYRSGLLVIP